MSTAERAGVAFTGEQTDRLAVNGAEPIGDWRAETGLRSAPISAAETQFATAGCLPPPAVYCLLRRTAED
jgi:hypothetical protein